MQLPFVKMHGLGNDFMIVEWPATLPEPGPEDVRRWSDRRRGVGFDSLLLVGARTSGGGARYRVLNADGGEAEQCGNGVRCLASYLAPEPRSELELTGLGGTVRARVLDGGEVSVDLGEPVFSPDAVPFAAAGRADPYRIRLASGEVELGVVSMGNPHAVIEVDSVDTVPVGILGAEMARHPDFPNGVNVGFMQRDSRRRIRLRVFERGAGETLACGTGAAAAVAVGRARGELDSEVEIHLPGGVLTVEWPGPGTPLWQTGATTKVYEGRIEI